MWHEFSDARRVVTHYFRSVPRVGVVVTSRDRHRLTSEFLLFFQRRRQRKPLSPGVRGLRAALGRLPAGQVAATRVRRRAGLVRAVRVRGRSPVRMAGQIHRPDSRPVRQPGPIGRSQGNRG